MDHVGSIADQWFLRMLESYPEQTAQFMRTRPDPFRNPVGTALRQALPVLVRQALGETKPQEVDRALDSIVRIRAVQDFSAREQIAQIRANESVRARVVR